MARSSAAETALYSTACHSTGSKPGTGVCIARTNRPMPADGSSAWIVPSPASASAGSNGLSTRATSAATFAGV